MRVVVAGSRSITNPKLVARAIEKSGFVITELIYGGARGVAASPVITRESTTSLSAWCLPTGSSTAVGPG
jgi:hypothetical protein